MIKNKKTYIGIIAGIFLLIYSIIFLSNRVVHLAYMTDSKYAPYTMVSIYSAIKNKKENSVYHIHIIGKDLKERDKKELQKLANKKVKIKIYEAQDLNLDLSHLGRFQGFEIALQKLFIANYLNEIDKVLYLDADTLVQEDLSAVYQTDLKQNYVAAVKDGLMYQHPEHIAEINLSWRNFYFNSGIMLLNLSKIRQDKIINRAIIYFNTHQEVFGDQDILNVVFKEKVKPLSYRYNCNSTFFEEKDACFLSAFYSEKISPNPKEVYDNAAILHFAGHKPWTVYFNHIYLKSLWQKYADEMKVKYQGK